MKKPRAPKRPSRPAPSRSLASASTRQRGTAPPRRKSLQSSPQSRLPSGGFSSSATVVWILLLIMPAIALHRLSASMDWRILAGALAFISIFTWLLYRSDKSKAQTGAWRTPESTLHLAEFAGGWPAAFLAQRRYRHKIAKGRYQFTYWCIVALHEYAALDCLLDWKISWGITHWLQRLT